MPELSFSTVFGIEELKEKHNLFRNCQTERHTLDSALQVFFKHGEDEQIRDQFYTFFKRRSLVTPILSDLRTNSADSRRGGDSDDRVVTLLPKIFDNGVMKGWRDQNSNIDTSIVLYFLEEFFSEQEPEEPLDVRTLLSAQNQRMEEILETVQLDKDAQIQSLMARIEGKPANEDQKAPRVIKLMTEEQVVEELLLIHHTALLRMQTCTKFCMDVAAEEKLIQERIPEFEESKGKYFTEALELCQKLSQEKCEKQIQTMFRKCNFENSYDLETIHEFQEDLVMMLEKVPKQFTERKFGSDRSVAFMAACR